MAGGDQARSSDQKTRDGRVYEIAGANDRIVQHAIEFRRAARLLMDNPPELRRCVAPYYMLGTFALELYLKALNSQVVARSVVESDEFKDAPEEVKRLWKGCDRLYDKSKARGHKLVELFDAIGEPFRSGLIDGYRISPVITGAGHLRDALAIYSSTFEDGRYLYEPDRNLPGQPVRDLMALVDFVESKNYRGQYLAQMRQRWRTEQ